MDVPEIESPPPKKRGLVKLIGMGLMGLVMLGIVGGVGIWIKNRAAKQQNLEKDILQELMQPQRIAFEAIAADSGAKEALGDDVKDAGGLGREGTGKLDRTATIIHFDVAGSKAKGRVTASTAFKQGAWQVTDEIQVQVTGGPTLKVPKPSEKPPDIDLGF